MKNLLLAILGAIYFFSGTAAASRSTSIGINNNVINTDTPNNTLIVRSSYEKCMETENNSGIYSPEGIQVLGGSQATIVLTSHDSSGCDQTNAQVNIRVSNSSGDFIQCTYEVNDSYTIFHPAGNPPCAQGTKLSVELDSPPGLVMTVKGQ